MLGHLSTFQYFVVIAINIVRDVFLRKIFRSKIAGLKVKYLCSFVRYYQFPSLLYSHQQYVRLPVSPQSCQQNVLSYLLICISQMGGKMALNTSEVFFL